MKQISELLTKKLRYAGYAERTIEVYVSYLDSFISDNGIKDPYQVSVKQINSYLLAYNFSSTSQQNQYVSALKKFCQYILKRSPKSIQGITRPKRKNNAQPVVPREKILSAIQNIDNLKHKAIITLGYGCGLRVSEVINLRWSDIERDNEVISIKNAKGGKNRYVPLPESLIDLLVEYWRVYKTKGYVFSGQDWRPQYSATSCNAIVKKHIGKKYRFHSLRKSFATHLFENGEDFELIREVLGHSKTETTRIYVESGMETARKLQDLL